MEVRCVTYGRVASDNFYPSDKFNSVLKKLVGSTDGPSFLSREPNLPVGLKVSLERTRSTSNLLHGALGLTEPWCHMLRQLISPGVVARLNPKCLFISTIP